LPPSPLPNSPGHDRWCWCHQVCAGAAGAGAGAGTGVVPPGCCCCCCCCCCCWRQRSPCHVVHAEADAVEGVHGVDPLQVDLRQLERGCVAAARQETVGEGEGQRGLRCYFHSANLWGRKSEEEEEEEDMGGSEPAPDQCRDTFSCVRGTPVRCNEAGPAKCCQWQHQPQVWSAML